jgi:hypothetical protein
MIIMRTILLSFLVASLVAVQCMAEDAKAKPGPRARAQIACFNGKLDSRASCTTQNYQADGVIWPKGKMKCGFPGQASEIEWSFVERHGDMDVYRFVRRFPLDSTQPTITSKTIEFSDRRVVVFEDKAQVIVIEPPKKEGLVR